MHDWGVWHGRVPFTDHENQHGRFVTEYGFQSFPQMSTIDAFTDPADRTSIFTPVMLAHQKNNEGNSIIQDYMLKYYAEPKDFPSFLYASQVLQAEGIKVGAEHHRRDRPRTMGSLYWQLNDCWPVASWSSIDYYGNWKALQYYARRFYAPLLVSPHIEDDDFTVYVVSDKTAPINADLRIRIMTFDGKVVTEHAQSMRVDPLSSKIYYAQAFPEMLGKLGVDPATVFVAADLAVDGQTVSTNLLYLVPTKQIHLPPAQIDHTLAPTPGKEGSYTLTLSSKTLARSAYITFGAQSVELSDNYFDLLPNEPRTITITSDSPVDALNKELKIISLADAFTR
ncbi:glycoside hydrolase family 2 protein [Edaphobacter aggregans]|uniref:glycoside hydrolase family 2 protein n=1 Tax=Edaphobacter aggregans TaxID=570835 RepID=UPI000A581363|nr:glycoside hydrolase family 2 protein [Edaphobacter aggregans]